MPKTYMSDAVDLGVFPVPYTGQLQAYDDFQNGTSNVLADYTIYDALINASEAWADVSSQTIRNCWQKTGIVSKRQLLNTTIQFSKGTNNWSILTDEDVIELVNRKEMSSESEAETETISNRTACTLIDTVLKYLYQQGPEFGEVVEEVKILRALRRWVELAIQKNLKQVSLHHFEDKMIEQ
ncbi:10731_t:CDS:2 [Paraglomus brasilianum]|uniref:10731_t:CDS:1 n=1 Tax=Paraglomus brasilianum TaxID=144538 RepID=A0A9N9AMT1_9GLOM|nr:10731_t:CDS:2 [Paraglomus brasilianum]